MNVIRALSLNWVRPHYAKVLKVCKNRALDWRWRVKAGQAWRPRTIRQESGSSTGSKVNESRGR